MRTISTLVLAVVVLLPMSGASDEPRIVIVPDGKPVVPTPMPAPVPVPIPTSATVTGERFELLTLTGYKGEVTWDISFSTAYQCPISIFPQTGPTTDGWRMGASAPAQYTIPPDTPTIKVYAIGDGNATINAWGTKDSKAVKLATFSIIANKGAQPPPEPKPPTPVAVTSFHVFLVYEAGSTLPPAQYGILFGIDVENALKAACNLPGASGWRRLDKDTNPNTLPAGLKEAWTAAKPAITAVPCIAYQVNDKITIEPLPATVADTTAQIAKYREGK